MTVTSSFHGHTIIRKNGQWEKLNKTTRLPIQYCNCCKEKIFNVDICLGKLPGVKHACCGHGNRELSYIMFNNGIIIRGFYVDQK